MPATALGIGAIAVVVASWSPPPLLPQPVARAGSGTMGTGPGIDATLQLGDDLRRPREVEVMLVRTDAPSAPYLRATTALAARGQRVGARPGAHRAARRTRRRSAASRWIDDIRLTEYVTSVEVTNLASPWLPVAYPAVEGRPASRANGRPPPTTARS